MSKTQRLGRFEYTMYRGELLQAGLYQVFAKVVPIKVEYDRNRDCFVCIGFSEMFDDIPLSEAAPSYLILMTKKETPEGPSIEVSATRQP